MKNDRTEMEAFLAGLAVGSQLGEAYSLNIAAIAWDEYKNHVIPRVTIEKMADLVEKEMPRALQFRAEVSQAQSVEAVKH